MATSRNRKEHKIIAEFLKEVAMFVKGERAQAKLFDNTEIDEAIDAIDADDSPTGR